MVFFCQQVRRLTIPAVGPISHISGFALRGVGVHETSAPAYKIVVYILSESPPSEKSLIKKFCTFDPVLSFFSDCADTAESSTEVFLFRRYRCLHDSISAGFSRRPSPAASSTFLFYKNNGLMSSGAEMPIHKAIILHLGHAGGDSSH